MPKRRFSNDRSKKGRSLSPRRHPAQLEIREQRRPNRETVQKSSELLINLSNACTRHAAHHEGRRHTVSEDGSIPETCRKALDTLTRILPKVEEAFEPPPSGDEGPAAHDVANLCDFYVRVLQGTYCPYLPHLFSLGKEPKQLMDKILYLFRHIITPEVLQTAKSMPSEDDDETSLRSVVHVISRTIGHLFSFLADETAYPMILSDILDLLMDSSHIIDNQKVPVRLAIMENTLRHFKLDANNNSLELLSIGETWLLQAATYDLLQVFLLDNKTNRLKLDALPPAAMGSMLSSGSIDSLIHDDLTGHDTTTLLLETLQKHLLSNHGEEPSALPIWQRRQLAASRILLLIVDDWHIANRVSSIILHTAATTAAHAALAYLRVGRRKFPGYENLLATVLQKTVLTPPRVEGGTPTEAYEGRAPVPVLLDCLQAIARCPSKNRNVLDATVLRILDSILNTSEGNNLDAGHRSFAANYSAYHGLYRPLVALIRDPMLSNFSVGIFGSLSCETIKLDDLNTLCSQAIDAHKNASTETTTTRPPADANNTQARADIENCIGTKRKRKNASPAKKMLQPLQLSPSGNRKRMNRIPGARHGSSNYGYSWQDAFRALLQDGLSSGRTLEITLTRQDKYGGNLHSQTRPSPFHSASALMGAMNCVGYAMLLAHRSSQDTTFEPLGCLQLMDLLCDNLRACCDHIASRSLESLGPAETFVAQIATNCALFLHCGSLEIFLAIKNCTLIQDLKLKLLGIASSALKLATTKLPKTATPVFAASNQCSRAQRLCGSHSVTGVSWRGNGRKCRSICQTPLCLCAYFRQVDNQRQTRGSDPGILRISSFTCSISAMESLPLRTRFCLLWSLALRLRSPIQSTSSMRDECLSTMSGAIEENISGSKPGDECRSVAFCLLSLVPALLLSLASLGSDEHAASKEDRDSTNSFSDLSQCFVEKTLSFVLSSAVAADDELYETTLLVMKRLQSFRSAAKEHEQGLWELKAHTTVEFLLGRNVFSEEALGDFVDVQLDGALHDLLYRITKHVQHRGGSSLTRWLLWGCTENLMKVSNGSQLRREPAPTDPTLAHVETAPSDTVSTNWPSWLLEAPFSDDDPLIRDYSSRKIGLLVAQENSTYLLTVFSSEGDLKTLTRVDMTKVGISGEESTELQDASDRIVSDFFTRLDCFMAAGCGLSSSIFSLTMAKASDDAARNVAISREKRTVMQRAAAKILISLCEYAGIGQPLGHSMYVEAYRRLARLWASNTERVATSSFPEIPSTGACRALSFGALTCFSQVNPRTPVGSVVLPDRNIAYIFCDIWLLNSEWDIPTRYSLLQNFIQSFLMERPDSLSAKILIKETSSYFEAKLAMLIGHLIVEKAREPINLTAGFRAFLVETIKHSKKTLGFNPSIAGGLNAPVHRFPMARDLEKKAKNMCLESNLIERILPQVLIHNDKEALKFFQREVLQDSVKVPKIIASKNTILKGLAWELGRDEATAAAARHAIKFAAIATLRDLPTSDDDSGSAEQPTDAARTNGQAAATQVVTSNFLYLLVNVVQFKWSTRTSSERLQALRSLYGLMDFLKPEAAARYFPHILATVNAAMVNANIAHKEDSIGFSGSSDFFRYHATKCLSKFVELVAGHQADAVAGNLMTIVVCLIPLLGEPEDGRVGEACAQMVVQKTRAAAINILEFLTQGKLGKSLAPSFREIPFLPTSHALTNVHQALLGNGVDYDNLVVLSSGTQEGRMDTVPASTSGTADSRASSSAVSGGNGKVAALQKRLNTICALLSNENTSIRNVALQHLIDLLRANRSNFHRLIENEALTTTKLYLTTWFHHQHRNAPHGHTARGLSPSGTVTEMMEMLLTRCVQEQDPTSRILLATCLGEVGAIGEYHLGELHVGGATRDDTFDAEKWRLDQPPWQSCSAKYELELVTRHLVVGLKAAPSSSDQHRIAFTIQQLLRELDKTGRQVEDCGELSENNSTKNVEMGAWLRSSLKEANVLEIVEPLWHSGFYEKSEGYVQRPPPFFTVSPSYFKWMSSFCRWMIYNSHDAPRSPWKTFFYHCRQAVRSEAGLKVTEFIFPLLVLDRLCFGTTSEESLIRQEFLDVLNVEPNSPAGSMNQADRQKSVSAFFSVTDTLTFWAESGTEAQHRSSRASSRHTKRKSGRGHPKQVENSGWPADETISRIDEVLSTIPLEKQAHAASRVGMYARALRLLEFGGRKETVQQVFESTTESSGCVPRHFDNPDRNIELRKDLLAQLDDCDSMAAVGGDQLIVAPSLRVRDSIRRKEASGDFEGALKDYERALQLQGPTKRDLHLETGILQCLLELGHFESVLKHAAGLKAYSEENYLTDAKLFAVEAAWRLGRWETLLELVNEDETDREGRQASLPSKDKHQVCIGKIYLGLRGRDGTAVATAVQDAREATMESLSVVARENYSRSYSEIVRLHCLRELENTAEVLLRKNKSTATSLDTISDARYIEGWEWDGRLSLAASRGASAIVSTRLALARINAEPALEGSLFLRIGKQARKNGLYGIAENFLSQAESVLSNACGESSENHKLGRLLYSARVQVAKLKHECGESTLALRLVGQENLHAIYDQLLPAIDNESKLKTIAVEYERKREANGCISSSDGDEVLSDRFVSRLLMSTQWMIEGGLIGGSEAFSRFRVIQKLAPGWEKGHFHFGKFVDALMQDRVTTLAKRNSAGENPYTKEDDSLRSDVLASDACCQKYVVQAMSQYVEALKISSKHVYQALPRLLSLWFEYTSIQSERLNTLMPESPSRDAFLAFLSEHKSKANSIIAKDLKQIPASAFYTAMPQLISRVTHDDKETALVVQSILQRVLAKFPLEAMWPLAWLKGSKNGNRSHIGEKVFKEAQQSLRKSNRKMQKILGCAEGLFEFLRQLAVYQGPTNSSTISIKPWKGPIELAEFIPPVQAALSVSPGLLDGRKDYFPRNVPRMRTFCSKIAVMSSKARPKRLKAFAIPAGKQATDSGSHASPDKCDIGEIHFLVKQEAKGDLRKDARVQDLNHVINRLMSSSSSSTASSRSRRGLRLRTFAVTCLSEDTGILEWVPHTDSLRNLVTKSYNPQTSSFCPRRRGDRIANFSDMSLRNAYERAQNLYFKEGHLSKAAASFGELCSQYPPLLYWWFVQNFLEPHAWYEARNSFALSAAAWSAVGHVIGLGDRHSENILVDTKSGQCVHVDFDCIFDKGLDLPRPEVIPFRLTQNMLDAFGPTGSDGLYRSGLQTAMTTLRENRDTLLSVLEPFTKDPVIDWRRSKGQQKQTQSTIQNYQKSRARRAIGVIDERLQGVYNLKNPNSRKYRRRDGQSADHQDDISSMSRLPVDGQVHKMIAEATSHENLVQLYVGWMPWV